jgi:hypothetical protein
LYTANFLVFSGAMCNATLTQIHLESTCDKDQNSYFELYSFSTIGEEDGTSVDNDGEEELFLESRSCDFSCQQK